MPGFKEMTTKEKAIELINLFKDNVNPYIGSGMLSNTFDDDAILWQSKMVATNCAKEVLKQIPMFTGNKNPNYEFWEQVITEIDNIVVSDIFTPC
jgi:hypothetical protein